MRSVRLEPELDDRLRQAATAEGSSISEFIRQAVSERAERTLVKSTKTMKNTERLAYAIGTVHGDGTGVSRDTGKAFGDLVEEKYHRRRQLRSR